MKFTLKNLKNQTLGVDSIQKQEVVDKHFIKLKQYNSKPIIKIQDVSMTFNQNFKKIKVLENINLDIYGSETTCILGANGAGKSTLIDIILSILTPTKGQVILDCVKGEENGFIGVQFQDLSFPAGISVWNLIKFSLNMSKKTMSFDEINEMLEVFKLKQFLKTQINKLSGGQQQRLNVLLAFLNLPKAIILDEYSTGLDISSKANITEFIKKFCDKYKISLILVTHDIDIIEQIGQRIIILKNKGILVDVQKEDGLLKYKTMSNFLNKYIY
ncbi:MAG: ATP-binding cassette domain-containing protein [Mycoplasma sp.]